MKWRSGFGNRALILFLLILAAALLMMGLCKNVLVLEIGRPAILVPVSEGDLVVRSYVHSMYDVPVGEKLRIENGQFRLFHVMTQSYAVLDYLGLERMGEPNADRKFTAFTIPAASIGNHVLHVHNRDFPLGIYGDRDGKIHVELVRVPLMAYITRLVWR